MISWRGWTDEARSHSTDGLVNGRPATADELVLLERARRSAALLEAAGLFSGVGMREPEEGRTRQPEIVLPDLNQMRTNRR